MIVDPDFVDHWKTRMLVDSLGFDEAAPIYVIRLWAHCQNRRKWVFEGLSPEALRAVCRFKGDAEQFEQAMIQSEFIERTATSVIVVGWEVYNSTLIASWKNGKKGGRPVKTRKNNPRDTHGIPTGEPMDKPTGNPQGNRLDRIGLDEIGEEKNSVFSSSGNPTQEGDDLTFLTGGMSPEASRIWEIYPKKTHRGKVQKALESAIRDVIEEKQCTDAQASAFIEVAAKEFAHSKVGKLSDPEKLPSLDRWLADHRFYDDRSLWTRPIGKQSQSAPEKPIPKPLTPEQRGMNQISVNPSSHMNGEGEYE